MRMLIVEDDDRSRRAMARLYALRGWEVEAVATAAEALAALVAPPDCLVLDLMLPDGDGEDVLREVRDARHATRVVVVTGVGDPGRLAAVAALGPDAVLRKPVDIAALCRQCGGPP